MPGGAKGRVCRIPGTEPLTLCVVALIVWCVVLICVVIVAVELFLTMRRSERWFRLTKLWLVVMSPSFLVRFVPCMIRLSAPVLDRRSVWCTCTLVSIGLKVKYLSVSLRWEILFTVVSRLVMCAKLNDS